MANDWQQRLNTGNYVAAAFLDIIKTFDTVNYDMFLQELLETVHRNGLKVKTGDSELQHACQEASCTRLTGIYSPPCAF